MLADVGAGGGEGIVLPDEPHGIGTAALVHQGDIPGDIHAGGAQGHAGHGVLQAAQAAVMEDVLLIVIPEALQAHENQVGGVNADGAVRRVHDDLGSGLDPVQDLQLGLALQHLPDHVGKLGQADAAGHALAAGLGLAQVQEIQRHVHRAQARRAGGDPPLHVPVQLLHHGLCLAGHLHFQSAHVMFLLPMGTPEMWYRKPFAQIIARYLRKSKRFLKVNLVTKKFVISQTADENKPVPRGGPASPAAVRRTLPWKQSGSSALRPHLWEFFPQLFCSFYR